MIVVTLSYHGRVLLELKSTCSDEQQAQQGWFCCCSSASTPPPTHPHMLPGRPQGPAQVLLSASPRSPHRFHAQQQSYAKAPSFSRIPTSWAIRPQFTDKI